MEGGCISAVVPLDQVPSQGYVHDFGEAAILPGLIDSHVHINEPGRTEWEGFETATRAAAAGGYTMLVDMPLNCKPPTTTVEALRLKREAARGKCHIDWGAWGGVVSDNHDQIDSLVRDGVLGFKCFLIHSGIDDFSMVDEKQLRDALQNVARSGLPLLVHAELPGPVDEATASLATADWRSYETFLKSRPDEAELVAIRLLISLCREYRFRLHVVHLSTYKGINLLRAARAEGLPITVESCPHYLHLLAETITDGSTQFKCAPPIRSCANREQLWQGLRDGVIEMVVTDHSPCPPAMKNPGTGDFRSAWGGIASLSVALAVVWTEASRRGFMLPDVVRWMAEKPAILAGCDSIKGRLAAGYDADICVFNPDAEFVVSANGLYHRHAVSPYLGETLRGVVKATYLRGELVFENGEFPGTLSGREYRH